MPNVKMKTTALLLAAFVCVGCADKRPEQISQANFNFLDTFGPVNDIEFVCHYADFTGSWQTISAAEIERWCACDIKSDAALRYKNTIFVISKGNISQAEADWKYLGYSGSLQSWRNEESFCFSSDRLSLDEYGNLTISGHS